MNELIQYVSENKGLAITTSRNVAKVFRKRHNHVLRDISNITEPKSGLSERFATCNFISSLYKDGTGRKLPEYIITKDGFIFLVMGYTGEKAAQFKEKYITEFNRMSDFIHTLETARLEFPAFTQSILQAHKEPKPYHFTNEIDMINRIVLGQTAKQFKTAHGLDESVHSIRPYLSDNELQFIEALQRADIGLVLAAPEFQIRKDLLKKYYENMQINALSA
jgi:Rha family phage regulatory protein